MLEMIEVINNKRKPTRIYSALKDPVVDGIETTE